MTTTTIRVTTELRDDLNLLKQIHIRQTGISINIDELIRYLLDAKLYNEEFFERIREKVIAEKERKLELLK